MPSQDGVPAPKPARIDAGGRNPRARTWLATVVAAVGVGIVMRVLLLASLPRFFGPVDPAVYYSMATAVLHTGVPRVDFVWNYSSLPTSISHVESYYEFGYAYLLAGVMVLFGSKAVVACALSLLCGVLAPVLTFVFTRRLGPRVAGVAAILVALEPWSIYYSGVIMKEVLVSVIVILALEALRRLIEGGGSRWGVGLRAAAVVLAASAFQYEMLLILGLAAGVTLLVRRRDALLPFVLSTALVVVVALAATTIWLGVPISGKVAFFSGSRMSTTEIHDRTTYASAIGLRRFLPLGYVLGALLIKWYVPIIVLAWLGSRVRNIGRTDKLLRLSFGIGYVYFHGVPHDLWERDFIPLLPVLAPLAALGVCRGRLWTLPLGRRWRRLGWMTRGTLAMSLMLGAATGIPIGYTLHLQGVVPVQWMPWSLLTTSLVMAGMFLLLVRAGSRVFATPAVQRALPALSLGIILCAFSQSLPWPWIFSNPQFADYEPRRWQREDAARELLRDTDPRAPVMTSGPAEVTLCSGHPSVLLPVTHSLPAIEDIYERYGVRYLLVEANELAAATPAVLSLSTAAHGFGYVLYEFPKPGSAHAGHMHSVVQPPAPPVP